jgi:hypothetical protein
MTIERFKESLSAEQPPASVSKLLQALWYDARGDWQRAHEIAQDIENEDGSWVHAYLHRKEGDQGNAAYWYRRAGKHISGQSLADEWDFIVDHLLKR